MCSSRPALGLLPRAFGGHLVLEMRNHHGEESPAFWIGVGRSAVLPRGVLMGALDEQARWAGGAPAAGLLGERAGATWRELVAGAFTLAPHIAGGLNTAMTGVLRSARFASGLALPSRAERDAWAAAFLAPLLASE